MKNNWSCLLIAACRVIGISLDEAVKKIGHDGSEIVFKSRSPYNRRAFHIQEIIDLCINYGYLVTPIDLKPRLGSIDGEQLLLPVSNKRFDHYLLKFEGIVTGVTRCDMRHAVAWKGDKLIDDTGDITDFGSFKELHQFWIINKYQ